MTQLWPRLSPATALSAYEAMDPGSMTDADTHPDQVFAATGGSRVTPAQVARLRQALEGLAVDHALHDDPNPAAKVAFDRSSAAVIRDHMDITCFEATQPGVWNFLALASMPTLTLARFGLRNRERWVASDLTRHMFARLWWQSYTFGVALPDGSVDHGLLNRLSESDLNQLTERRSIGGTPRLAQEVARQYLETDPTRRRDAIRAITRTISRLTPFMVVTALSDGDLREFVTRGLSPTGDE